ncbi:MAG: prepilin-type N-terminal cleavage/methylation domain-containing protein [Verrucomicrobia bacterium]|nr:prepilin-type N-terminal cleavage/methylation domain-containing protein [Verrucomicrobiota bacterium]
MNTTWSPRTRRLQARAFTLIELLSTVAIIGVLAALLLTAIVSARAKAKGIVCLKNVRQMGLGITQFTTEHGEYPLGLNRGRSEGKNPEHRAGWMVSVQFQIEPGFIPIPGTDWMSSGIWDCPATAKPDYWPRSLGYIEYGYNANGLGVGTNGTTIGIGGTFNAMAPNTSPPVKEDEVVNPSGTLAAGDGFTGWNGVVEDGHWSMSRWPLAEETLGSTQRSQRRHKARANVVFCDGHAESLTLKTLFTDTSDEALRLWNRDGLPHRERLKEP